MTTEDLRKYQLAQLELIEMVDKLCGELNLRYYIIGGTALGAVRHGGFIPWDPDIDIAMPRADYEKMREWWSSHDSERYFYQHYSSEKNHLAPHALVKIKNSHVVFGRSQSKYKPKYDGIYLDIFPLDNAPTNKKKQEKQMRRIKKIKTIVVLKAGYVYKGKTSAIKKAFKRVVQILLSPVSFNYLNRKLDAEMMRYDRDGGEYLVSMASHYSYWKQLMPETVYGEPQRIQFEGLSLCAPADLHDYLKRLFNDYMKLPPEEQRNYEMNWIERVEYGEAHVE